MVPTEEKCTHCGEPYSQGCIDDNPSGLCETCKEGLHDALGSTAEFLASPEAVAGVVESLKKGKDFDFTVTAAKVTNWDESSLVISWETKSAGFGELTFYRGKDGKIEMDTEAMSKRFVLEVVGKLLEDVHDPNDS